MESKKILPIEEMVAYDEFTDRFEILRELSEWVKNIQRMAAPSTAIIAPRRIGKTVLLDRLVNSVFYQPENKVAPFYIRIKREETTLREFLLEYATTFFRQFIAYCIQDPILYSDKSIQLEYLLDYQIDHKAVNIAKEFIEGFLRRYKDNRYNDTRNQWDAFICVPERLGSFSGIRVAVIIDEFQDMKFYIHDVEKESLTDIIKERSIDPYMEGTDLTATYDRQAQSRKAPMLVSGSAVTLVFRTVMGGPLGGRFDFIYLKPMSIPDGATLLNQLLMIYGPNVTIRPENAFYAATQVGGHPYYIYCLAMSKYENKYFNNKDAIDRIIRYEIEEGKIYGFWQTHFEDNKKYINSDNDEQLGKKIMYYFTKYNNQSVDIKQIAATLQVPNKAVEEKIEKLYLADIVFRTSAKYYTFNDICLMRYIKFAYEKDLTDIDQIDLSQQNLFNTLKGKFLEIVIQVTMMKFNYEKISGSFFGKVGEIELPVFQVVDTKYVKAMRTSQYQIDVCGRLRKENCYWICECKYTKIKMGIKQVEKLEKAAEALKQESIDTELPEPKIQLWLVSTGGFTDEVLTYVTKRADIYCSDYDGINNIFSAFGGNYKIPIF
ncbi:ATPase domain protein, prokaryote domain protein [Candidatus Magnetomorum sp. HK-1]|nr:ATPase domain protein, prokaryote domain protein [Candidatus Magnetomorum sp. HK-1]